jgi:hypothetical protein
LAGAVVVVASIGCQGSVRSTVVLGGGFGSLQPTVVSSIAQWPLFPRIDDGKWGAGHRAFCHCPIVTGPEVAFESKNGSFWVRQRATQPVVPNGGEIKHGLRMICEKKHENFSPLLLTKILLSSLKPIFLYE